MPRDQSDATWEDLAQQFEEIRTDGEPLWAEWFAHEGSENQGIWLLRPEGRVSYQARITFSLLAAKAIEKLGIAPLPVPQPEQHFPGLATFYRLEENIARQTERSIFVPEASPHGLGQIDRDAVDPCSRAWLEFLRRESPAFEETGHGGTKIRETEFPTVRAKIWDVARASAIFCRRLAREAIRERFPGVSSGTSASVITTCAGRDSVQDRGGKKPSRRNKQYELIDKALASIAQSKPSTQEEVFEALQSRKTPVPPAEPFYSAGGWMLGFRKDEPAARAWLSKRWAKLNLPVLPRGPKNEK